MTQQFFPPDVSLRLGGNRAQAQTHIKDARELLFKAINTGLNPTSLIKNFDDGTTIVVRIAGNQKIVSIAATPMVPLGPVVPEPEIPQFEPTWRPPLLMLSGWTKTHSVVSSALRSFHPSDPCARAYDLDDAWQDSAKLNTTPLQVTTVTPSLYTGSMKRVVQALLGLGKYRTDAPAYLTGLTSTAERSAVIRHDYQWMRSHGIYRAGPKNHWIIEVSQANGVLAMPLITIPRTRSPSFRAGLIARGDTDTVKVIDEFGGIPSDEGMPTGNALITALAQGRVLRLLTAAQMEPFYKNKGPYSPYLGWAFAETLGEARNTCWAIGRSIRGNAQYFRAEHWKLAISLTPHDTTLPDKNPPEPVGTGGATLELVNAGMLSYWCLDKLYIPISENYTQSFLLRSGLADYDGVGLITVAGSGYAATEQNIPVGGDISVFFDRDTLKRFSWVPWVYYVDTNVTTGVGAGAVQEIDRVWSPQGFVVTGYDPRVMNQTDSSSSPVTGTTGSEREQDIWGLLPRDTREAAVIPSILYQRVYNGWNPSTTTRTFSCVGMFSGIGRVNIPMPVTNQTVFNSTYPVYGYPYDLRPVFAARVSAHGTQYVMSSQLKVLAADPIPTPMTNVTGADLSFVQPYNMNWVGAPD